MPPRLILSVAAHVELIIGPCAVLTALNAMLPQNGGFHPLFPAVLTAR